MAQRVSSVSSHMACRLAFHVAQLCFLALLLPLTCRANDLHDDVFDITRYLSTNSRYEYSLKHYGGAVEYLPAPPAGCRPVHVNLLARHGTREPTKKRMVQVDELSRRLLKEISPLSLNKKNGIDPSEAKDKNDELAVTARNESNRDEKTTHRCGRHGGKLPQWLLSWDSPWVERSHGGSLAPVGEQELYEMGKRFRRRFSELLDQGYDPAAHPLIATKVVRTSSSAVAFGMGLLEGHGSLGKCGLKPFAIKTEDAGPVSTLRFHEVCDAYKDVKKVIKKAVKAELRSVYAKIAESFSHCEETDMAFMTAEGVEALWQLCKQQATLEGVFDQACALFSEEQLIQEVTGNKWVEAVRRDQELERNKEDPQKQRTYTRRTQKGKAKTGQGQGENTAGTEQEEGTNTPPGEVSTDSQLPAVGGKRKHREGACDRDEAAEEQEWEEEVYYLWSERQESEILSFIHKFEKERQDKYDLQLILHREEQRNRQAAAATNPTQAIPLTENPFAPLEREEELAALLAEKYSATKENQEMEIDDGNSNPDKENLQTGGSKLPKYRPTLTLNGQKEQQGQTEPNQGSDHIALLGIQEEALYAQCERLYDLNREMSLRTVTVQDLHLKAHAGFWERARKEASTLLPSRAVIPIQFDPERERWNVAICSDLTIPRLQKGQKKEVLLSKICKGKGSRIMGLVGKDPHEGENGQIDMLEVEEGKTPSPYDARPILAALLEWADDVETFKTRAYGTAVNYRMAMPLVHDMLQAMDVIMAHTKERRSGFVQRAHLRFAHAETVIPLTCLLGLFLENATYLQDVKEGRPLPPPPPPPAKRVWHGGRVAPYASNLELVLYHCRATPAAMLDGQQDATEIGKQAGTPAGEGINDGLSADEFRVLALHNEKPVIMPACGEEMFCPFKRFKEEVVGDHMKHTWEMTCMRQVRRSASVVGYFFKVWGALRDMGMEIFRYSPTEKKQRKGMHARAEKDEL
ncbi:hypothetical protein CBR_g38028 [Chara braunii]|uniref:Multiple inositol polyphosphate phosphatase 1 n=1 Tax=Chara braunii TaxID=69332 RepID=A0A388K057_CHABU|nr:hypothetical protein CBR_g38028 [Chara braunii]|eukprot:GBG63405.1 hypothetical protein CBR_g38028 [Chara braunii]